MKKLIGYFAFIILFSACQKELSFEASSTFLAKVITNTTSAYDISATTVNISATITSTGGSAITERGFVYSINPDPDITDSIVLSGAGTGFFNATIIELTEGTDYYVRAYARNSTGIAYGNQISFTTQGRGFIVTDCDGNIYHTVTIGTQTWMVENLRTTRYRDCRLIPNVTDKNTWAMLATDAYANYNNYSGDAKTYGRLYNWYAVDNIHNIAPVGCHVPSDAEWVTLLNYLGGQNIAGGKLKESGLAHWLKPNTAANNSSQFTALPGGIRYNFGLFYNRGNYGNWWSSTEYGVYGAYGIALSNTLGSVERNTFAKSGGFSVRCICSLNISNTVTISNPSLFPITQSPPPPNTSPCGGYVISDFTCPTINWDATLSAPKFTDANGNSKIVNGAFLENVTNNWGWSYTSCTSSNGGSGSFPAVIFYNTSISNGMVRGKVKVIGDFGSCTPPYINQYFTSFKFTLINSSLSTIMQTNYNGTYQLASNSLTTHQ